MKVKFVLYTLLTVSIISACEKATEPKKEESVFRPTASIQEIMQSIIDPNIDPIWESIQTISTAAGVEEKHPKTDEDWATLRNHAITLREATNLLLIEGRAVAKSNTSTVAAELSPDEIQKLIAANKPAFIKNVHDLQDAITQTLTAIEAKDIAALEATGGVIDQTCEKCHMQFWYPGDKRPTN